MRFCQRNGKKRIRNRNDKKTKPHAREGGGLVARKGCSLRKKSIYRYETGERYFWRVSLGVLSSSDEWSILFVGSWRIG